MNRDPETVKTDVLMNGQAFWDGGEGVGEGRISAEFDADEAACKTELVEPSLNVSVAPARSEERVAEDEDPA